MSEENVELIRTHHAGFIAQDPDIALAPLDPDVEFIGFGPAPGVVRGHDEVLKFTRRWVGAWEDYFFEPLEYRDLGDQVLVRVREGGRGKGSGVVVEREAFQVWTCRGGKAVRCMNIVDEAEALEAAGLTEAGMPEEGLEPPTRGL
jgi:ketosteroid isomerase-like protein